MSKIYILHMPDNSLREIVAAKVATDPKPDMVFWLFEGYFRFFQILECSEEDIYVEEICRSYYQDLLDRKDSFFFFKRCNIL